MKLLELYEPNIKSVQRKQQGSKQTHPVIPIMNYSDKIKAIGKGKFAQVFGRPQRPHSVVKVMPVKDINKNGYYKYIHQIADVAQSNPFLPRIYGAKFIADKQDKDAGYFIIEMEKLHPLTILDVHGLIAIGNQCIEGFQKQVDTILKLFPNPDGDYAYEVVKDLVITPIDNLAYDRHVPEITNKKLIQAVKLITHIIQNNSGSFNDIHEDNVMIRLTPAGPQLVITDPIADH